MDKVKHAVTSVKEKLTGPHGHEQQHKHEGDGNTAVKDTAPYNSHAPVNAAHQDPRTDGHPVPRTHGHPHSDLDPPGAPGIIETPAPGVVGSGTMAPGLVPSMMPRI